ncbi:hypothetical protein BJV82DRAFT_673104 [Fennellomyces sp. T-0311]|nr:hypothetical protein BJV82DRAFT_673104 [Fennellomyces sp. T-0311]
MEPFAMKINQLSLLPLEIQDSVLRNLTFRECMRLSSVCRTWRSMVLNWQGMWETLSTDDNHNITDLEIYKNYIEGSFVNRIRLDTRSGDQLERVIDFLVMQKCTAIQKVDFHLSTMETQHLFQITSLCGNRLTEIALTLDEMGPNNVTPDVLLLNCPHLKKLYYSSLILETTHWKSTLVGLRHQHLIDLALDIYIVAGEFDARPFLEAAPQLRRLTLPFRSVRTVGSSLPSMLQQYCPKFANLVLISGNDYGIHIPGAVLEELSKADDPGLDCLVLRDTSSRYPVARDIIHQLDEEWCSRLKRLDLAGDTILDEAGLIYLSTLVFPSLTHLALGNIMANQQLNTRDRIPPTTAALCSFLSHCVPNLVSLRLQQLGTGTDGVLLALVSGAKFLQELTLDMCMVITLPGLIQFLKVLSDQGRTVKTLELRFMVAMAPKLMDALMCDYRPVITDRLVLYGCSGISVRDLERTCDKAKCLDGFNKLDLTFVHGNLAKHPNSDDVKRMLDKLDTKVDKWTLTLQMFAFDAYRNSIDQTYHPYKKMDHVLFRKRKQTSC